MYVTAHDLYSLNANRQPGIQEKRKPAEETGAKSFIGYVNQHSAAELSISEKAKKQAPKLSQGSGNAQENISMCQVADGALSKVNSMLNRVTRLSVMAAGEGLKPEDRHKIQSDINHILSEINQVGNTTTFQSKKVFNADYQNQTSGGAADGHPPLGEMNLQELGLENMRVTTIANAKRAIDTTENALRKINASQSKIKDWENQLEQSMADSGPDSPIPDTLEAAQAEEMLESSKNNILGDAGHALRAQSNHHSNQEILSLLQ